MRAKPSSVIETMYNNKNMADIVVTAKDLDVNSKIELFSFMSSMHISYMENTNGIFFSLTNLTDNALQDIKRKLDELKSYETISNQQFAHGKLSEDFDNSGYASDKSESFLEEQGTGCQKDDIDGDLDADVDVDVSTGTTCVKKMQTKPSFECCEDMLKYIDKNIYKNSKKNIHSKYSVAKKKYNKQFVYDTKKIDSNDLSELAKETYIVN